MPLQNLSNASGKRTAVVTPIIDTKLPSSIRTKPSDFRGSLSEETANDVNRYIDESKKEWENDALPW